MHLSSHPGTRRPQQTQAGALSGGGFERNKGIFVPSVRAFLRRIDLRARRPENTCVSIFSQINVVNQYYIDTVLWNQILPKILENLHLSQTLKGAFICCLLYQHNEYLANICQYFHKLPTIGVPRGRAGVTGSRNYLIAAISSTRLRVSTRTRLTWARVGHHRVPVL